MSKKGIYLNHKEKKHTQIDAARRCSGILQSKVTNDIKQRNTANKYDFKDDNYTKGIEWFNSGLSLDDAPLEMKNNGSFIKGFQRGKTVKLVNDTLYDTGKEYYLNGILLENTPENYRTNEYFILGYNDAKKYGKHK